MVSKNSVRVRFAPSPTGHLHIGGLRTAFFNWLFARHNNGVFLLRIEDTDTERSTKEYLDSILTTFEWVDLTSDEPILIQSQRIKEHTALIAQLLKQGKAYKCYCSQEEVTERYHRQHGQTKLSEDFVKYDGKCRAAKDQPDVPAAIRFALPEGRTVVGFNDLIRGRIEVATDQLDDFIIARSDGTPMYNFVVVCDDAHMRISHIIRGEEHISNTPKQILLYEALHFPLPQFAHTPMILGPDGNKLSKRDAATSVLEYKEDGYLPDALLNYLVRLSWSHGDQEIFTRQELINYFTLDNVGKKGAIFDPQKLAWVNGVYMRAKDPQELLNAITTDVQSTIKETLSGWSQDQIKQAIVLFRERVNTLGELVDQLRLLHDGPQEYKQADIDKWITPETLDYLKAMVNSFEEQPHVFKSSEDVSALLGDMSKRLGVKLVTLAQPIRIALLGSSEGPGVFALIALVGREHTIKAINALENGILAARRNNIKE